jgi:hypothetical protein
MILIEVKYIETPEYERNEDGEFKCPHYEAEVIPPCCDGRDCGCRGGYGVDCRACNNEDLTDNDVDNIIEAYIGSREEIYDI